MKDMECKDCPIHCRGMHGGKAHLYMFIGILAFVYGAVNYLSLTYAWAPYTEWMVGGAVLVLIGWAKKMWKMKKMEE